MTVSKKVGLGSDIDLIREKDFHPGGVNPPEADKLFEQLATRSLEFNRQDRNPRKGAPERANLTFFESIN